MVLLVAAAIGSTPVVPALIRWADRVGPRSNPTVRAAIWSTGLAALSAIFFVSAAMIAAGTYNPFIYFRF